MTRPLAVIAILASTVLMSVLVAFPQEEEFKKNVRKHMDDAERKKMQRTSDENKLEGALYEVLRIAEQADTSLEEAARLTKRLRVNKNLRVDQRGRIKVDILLRSASEADSVAEIIRSLDGEVEHIGLAPYIECRIHPKKLRGLLSVESIVRIQEEENGRPQSIVSPGN